MVRALVLAVMLTAAAPAVRAAECGAMASQERTDAAANAVVRAAVLADAQGRPQAARRFVRLDGSRVSAEALARLPRGWLAGAGPVEPDDIGVWSLNRSGLAHNVMLVQIGEGDRRISRRLHLRCPAGLWVIAAVVHADRDILAGLLSAQP